jgi:hypothetical protein
MYQQDLARTVAADMLADPLAQQQLAALPTSYATARGAASVWLIPFLAGALTVGLTALVALLVQRK